MSPKSTKLQDNYKKCVLMRKHLYPNNSNSVSLQLIASIDTRDRSRSPEMSNEETPNALHRSSCSQATTDTSTGDEKKEDGTNERIVRFVAWYHFHSKIIEKYAFNKTTQQYSYT
mmetsp:Transcript_26304/g.29515  ORF Transcript_26304/g.29515 Transcript_26304/m.29515 type:complete len:115 (-) Transcript_26304:339-683(-)